MSKYSEYISRAEQKHGDKFSDESLAPQFVAYFNSGDRVKVVHSYKDGEAFVRTGTVGITTGWQPAFLLMHRSNDTGSWDVLGPNDRVVAVKRGREYIPV